MRTRVEMLYFDGCPGHEQLLPVVARLAAEFDAVVIARAIETPEHAHTARFLGSPTVRVDGCDVEPGADERTDFGMKCRLYPTRARTPAHAPREEWIREALAAAAGRAPALDVSDDGPHR